MIKRSSAKSNAGIVSADGTTLFNAATGPSDISTGNPMADDQVFWIASCTKIVTAIACMQLVERGTLSLHEPLGTLCPELAEPECVWDYDVREKHL